MNHETHNVRLWLLNDESLYNLTRELTNDYLDAYDLSQALRGEIELLLPDLDAGIASDLLTIAFQSVDFYALAQELIESYEDDNDR